MALIILDRDGVINHDSDNYIRSVAEWEPITGSIEAMARLHQAGHKVAIATNQSGLARGYYAVSELQAMHAKMHKLLADAGGQVDYITYCPHSPKDQCACRKPAPGMLLEILQHFQVSAEESLFVGDTYSDYQAAINANSGFTLVLTGKGERTLAMHPELATERPVFTSLQDFVADYLSAV